MMKQLTYLLLPIIMFACSASIDAQSTYTSTNKKAVKYMTEAKAAYNGRQDDVALELIVKALEKDPKFVEAFLLRAAIYEERRMVSKALDAYMSAIEINPKFESLMYISAAALTFTQGEYEETLKLLKFYKQFPATPPQLEPLHDQLKANCEFAVNAIKNPVPFKPVNMGPNINSELDEYFPCVTADNGVFLYTRKLPSKQHPMGYQEDFYIARRTPDGWSKSQNLGKGVNTPLNEGAATISPNGQLLIYTMCELYGSYGPKQKGYGSCDLFFTQWNGNFWSKPRNMGKTVNSGIWESQPSFAPDGRTVYFVRGNKRKGVSTQDIYKSVLQDNGLWGAPQRLGKNVNTKGREEFVSIHPDGRTLYFASDGHPGMGGLDLFMSKLGPDGKWGKPKNLGYPINTKGNESSVLVTADGKLAYFHSDREGGVGGIDLYTFEVPEHMKPDPVTYLKGTITDKKTGVPLEARFELIDLSTGARMVDSYSDKKGNFLVCITAGKEYMLNVNKEGYLFHSENFELTGKTNFDEPYEKDVQLTAPVKDEEIVLRNVFFDTDKATLKDKSKIELDRLATMLEKTPDLNVVFEGHTDNQGGKAHNLDLSKRRAKAVFDYIVSKGIPAARLGHEGYGQSRPIADNGTTEGRALNRRTVCRIR